MDRAFVGAKVVALHDQHSLPKRRLELIQKAERSIWVSTYSYSDDELTRALISAGGQGREVHLLLHAQKKGELSRRNDGIHAQFEAAKAVNVRRMGVHAKCVVVDERYVLLGSQNCSLGKKLEFTLEFDDEPLGRELVARLDLLAQGGSSQVTSRARKRERNQARARAVRARSEAKRQNLYK